jgi:hypothetical protein
MTVQDKNQINLDSVLEEMHEPKTKHELNKNFSRKITHLDIKTEDPSDICPCCVKEVVLPIENVITALILELIDNPKVAEIFNRISKEQHDEGDDEYLLITKEALQWYAEMYQHGANL